MLENIEDYENTLNELSTLKPPGVSGSRIKNLKEYFLSHKDEQINLVSLLINSCKNIPVSNKLGVLYVIDATTRGLIDEIGNVDVVSSNPSIIKIQENIEDLLNISIPNANEDVQDRICKLIEIWINSSTFDKSILLNIKDKYFKSHTPPGTPPKKNIETVSSSSSSNSNSNSNSKSNDPSSVLQALASLAKSSPSPNTNNSTSNNTNNNTNTNNSINTTNSTNPTTVTSPPSSSTNTDSANSSNPNAIFQLLQNMNKMTNKNDKSVTSSSDRDRTDRPRMKDRERDRDRSPTRNNNYTNNNFNSNEIDPPTHDGERNIPSNPHYRMKKSFVDPSIPQGCINVFSRTIFIGGVPNSMDEYQLVDTLKPYAEVQSVVINTSRRHAFVKVYSRAEADKVIQAFSVSHPSGLRARWGVGFGPRDCCNYQTGISTIPIQRLTDADKKWIISAEWGGSTNDLPLQSGLFVEEPDIEVGHGVSSKSISRKMPTNSSHNGPKSDNQQRNNNNYNNHNNHNNHNNNRYNNNSNPNNMPINYGGYNNNNNGLPQPPQNYQNMPYQQQQAPYQQPLNNQFGYQQPPMSQPPSSGGMAPNMMGSPNSMPMSFNQVPGQPPMDQAAMMQAMMQAMTQMQGQNQGQQGQGQPDMSNMLQVMANMMQQQGQQPPR